MICALMVKRCGKDFFLERGEQGRMEGDGKTKKGGKKPREQERERRAVERNVKEISS